MVCSSSKRNVPPAPSSDYEAPNTDQVADLAQEILSQIEHPLPFHKLLVAVDAMTNKQSVKSLSRKYGHTIEIITQWKQRLEDCLPSLFDDTLTSRQVSDIMDILKKD